ncbi:MAG TPA: malonyl CoA-acyl carrier protein transacylase, partial [Alphaproteobacteria bacterium]|nr:malonyl CoA-acyl carrier protein transacylase [Alphaproteobacteria bacterium]
ANDNSEGQVVISGTLKALEKAEEISKFMNAKRFLKLPVSAPFHSSLIKSAQDIMFEALEKEQINTPAIPVIANVTAQVNSDVKQIRELLVKQVTGRVRWRESVSYMKNSLDVTKTVEIGAGKVLSGLVKRIVKDVETINIETPQDIEFFCK